MENNLIPLGQTVDYAALKALLPRRGFGVADKIADLLNSNKILPLRAKYYTFNNVHQIMHKHFFDVNIEPALIFLIEELYGKPIEELLPDYKRIFPKRDFKRKKVKEKLAD